MKNVLYIGNKLHSSKHNVSYISILGPLLEREGITVRYASSYQNKVLRLLHMVVSVFRFKGAVNAVLIDTYSTKNFYFALIVSWCCRILKIPYVPILHGGNLKSRLQSSPKMSRMIFNHAKINIAPSIFIKEQFNSYGYVNIMYIPNTLVLENYPFTVKSFDYPKLLWVRAFSKIYNPKLAVEVLQNLKATYPKAELCMVGPDTGDDSFAEVKKMARTLNLQVQFTGKLSKKEWIALSENYNVFINTSNFDNMPVSVIEAMALGCAVVSTNVGGMPFLLTHTEDGLLVAKDDKEAMSQAIISVFVDVTKTKLMVKKARQKIEQFDWHILRRKWLEVLEPNNSSS